MRDFLEDLNAWLSDEHDQDDFEPGYLLVRRDDVRAYRDAARERLAAVNLGDSE